MGQLPVLQSIVMALPLLLGSKWARELPRNTPMRRMRFVLGTGCVIEVNTMTKWTYYLPSDVYSRLCRCASLKSDILPLAQAKWESIKDNTNHCKEDALVDVLELLDCNGNYFDLTREEYDSILSQM